MRIPHFQKSSGEQFLSISKSDISTRIFFSLLEHGELEGTIAFGRAGDRSSSDVDGHGYHPWHPLRPNTNQPFGIIDCVINGDWKIVANLYDLRTPTAFTLTLTTIFPFGCTNIPTVTLDPTLIVDGTTFPAQSSVVSFIFVDNTVSFVFPGITVTALTPGEPLTYTDRSGEPTTYGRNCHTLLIQGILFLLTHLRILRRVHVLQLRKQFLRLILLLFFILIADD